MSITTENPTGALNDDMTTQSSAFGKDWGHAEAAYDEDQRVYNPHIRAYPETKSGMSETIKKGFDQVQEKFADFDQEKALDATKQMIVKYPWQSALVSFALGALLGHRIFRR